MKAMSKKYTIVVIDDEKDLAGLIQMILQADGRFKPVLAYDGQEGIEVCRQEHPDLILLDCVMPRVKGSEVIQILSEDPVLKKIPIVLMSGLEEKAFKLKFPPADRKAATGQSSPVVAYLSKPFTHESLFAALGKGIKLEKLE